MIHSTFENLGYGITRVDTGLMRPGMAACYVMQHNDEVAIIETGTLHTVPVLLSFLDDHQIDYRQVRYVIPTHVHLDHAGGAGGLMQQLPAANLVIHPRGARHMISPEKLKAGAIAVYGEAGFADMYGDIIPVAEDRVMIAEDNHTLEVGGRTLQFMDTPGHARHHFCVYDPFSSGIFSGDTFGLAYPELAAGSSAFILPTTTPVQFEPEALKASIARLMSHGPERMYMTHYGLLESPARFAEPLVEQIDDYVSIAEKYKESEHRESDIAAELTRYTLQRLQSHSPALSEPAVKQLLEMDMNLNAQGLAVWLNKRYSPK
ncbi:MAG: MBL fold metallo-hydrolase [Ketobacteraceae bacterium]|nr:MBL fold metallo-hydrolase [Ketobacteraceae bacterium]